MYTYFFVKPTKPKLGVKVFSPFIETFVGLSNVGIG